MKTIIYSIYLASKTQENTHGTYKFSFVLYLSLLFFFHFFPLSLLLNLIFEDRIEIFALFNNYSKKISFGVIFGAIILFNYIYFIKMEKLQNIIKQFHNKSFLNKYYYLVIILYTILLFILVIVEREYFKSK
jgi:hypothetical protein